MAIELEGKIMRLLAPQSGNGARGEWKKQEFILETMEQYPKKVCISLWGDKVEELSKFPVGSAIKASINIESREFNGKWYTDIRAWKIDSLADEKATNVSPTVSAAAPNDVPPLVLPEGSFIDTDDSSLPF